MRFRPLLRLVLVRWVVPSVAVFGALTACNATNAASPTDPSSPIPSDGGACDVHAVLQGGGCLSCHSSPGASADLDLSAPQDVLAAQLLDAPSRTAVCAGRRLVDSRDPEASVLLSAVDHARRERAGACALAMPPGGGRELPSASVACLEQWVRDLTKKSDEEPFEPQPIEAAIAKAKLLVHGAAVTAEELAAVKADPGALRSLVDGWSTTPEFAAKMRTFLGTALQQDSIGTLREGPGFPTAHFTASDALRESVSSSFVDTALDVVTSGRPFTEVVTTRTRKVSTAELVLLAYSEQTSSEIASARFDVRLVGPRRKKDVPATLTKVGDVWELGGAAAEGEETCRFNPGKGPVPAVQTLSAAQFLSLLFGRVRCRDTLGDLKFSPPVTAADHETTRNVTFTQASAAQVAFYDLAKLRAIPNGGLLPLRVPRVGFSGTTVFLDNWRTNPDNAFRVTLNQTLLVGLGATFAMGDPTPNASSGIDEAHANPSSPCYGCHRLMDPMRPLLSNGADTSYRATSAAPVPATFAFFGQRSEGTTADDLARAVVSHPRFASAWALKVCGWATSRACSEAEPGVTELAASFRDSGFDFRKLVVDVVSSPVVTGLSGGALAARPIVSIARRRHLCAALRVRLGPSFDATGVCALSDPSALGRLVSDDTFARGQADLVQTAAPGTIQAAGLDRLCTALAPQIVTVSFPPAEQDASVRKLVESLMGLPLGHPRHDAAIGALGAHVASVIAAGGSTADAMQSAFIVACSSPDFAGAGL